MKKKWIEYSTEIGERWEFLKNITDIDNDNDSISSLSGNRAVYKKVMQPTDIVVVSIIPSERIIDDVTNQRGKDKQYYLMLELLNDEWFCLSQNSYIKEEIIKLSTLFVGLNKVQAEKLWNMKKMGDINTCRLEKGI